MGKIKKIVSGKNNSKGNTTPKNHIKLEEREDLFNDWIIKSWFTSGIKWQSLQRIFIELFMSLYDDLSEKFNAKKRDELFLNFINVVFPTVLDVYKWHESEKENHDIGLLKALESIALCDWYIELLTSYSKQYNDR